MRNVNISDVIERRDYDALTSMASDEVRNGHWEDLVDAMHRAPTKGKARDALVNLLQLVEVGGTDSNVFGVFRSLNGSNLDEIRIDAHDIAVGLLKKQIEHSNTYFIDTEGVSASPFFVFFDEITECRRRELANLKPNASRNDILLTYYGFMILTMSGLPTENANQTNTRSYYRYWRRRYVGRPEIARDAVEAITQLTRDFGTAATVNGRYETLGTSNFFGSKCQPYNSRVLSEITRMCLYMTPWDRAKAAKHLGALGDARALPHMHNCLETESDYRTKATIAESIGLVGHESSIELLEYISQLTGRRERNLSVAAVRGLGSILSSKSTDYLVRILQNRDTHLMVEAISGLSRQKCPGLVQILGPLLGSNSRPVLRSAVQALLASGKEGEKVITEKLSRVVRKLYPDRVAKHLIPQLLRMDAAQNNAEIHEYFIGRLTKSIKKLKQLERVSNRFSNQWYQQRVERKVRSKIEADISVILANLSPIPDSFVPIFREIAYTTGMNRVAITRDLQAQRRSGVP